MTEVRERAGGRRALWRVEEPAPRTLREELPEVSPMLCHLLYCRGIRTPDAVRAFLAVAPVSHDPFLIPSMDEAVDRIALAVSRRERIAVFGDFDCDGVTAAAVLVETLRGLGVEPEVYIPQRTAGHGLNPEGLALLADRGVSLIVSADCGITALEEVRVARGMGMDVVVTDHHAPRADGSLPDCPVVAPTRHDSLYPFRHLCGAGVAYKLAQALHARAGGPATARVLDLVALGTVADVVPIVDENRSIVQLGLDRLRATCRPGLLALFAAAGVERAKIDPIAIAFYLAPRLNAANRLADPRLAYDLLTATDPAAAARLAAELSRYNVQRQTLVTDHLALLVGRIGTPAEVAEGVLAGRRSPLLIVGGPDLAERWPGGISGLLASKLAEFYGLPVFAASVGADGTVAASGRGVPGVYIDELLERCDAAAGGSLFYTFGGHSGAGGFCVAADRFAEAVSLLEEQARSHVQLEEIGPVRYIDAEVSPRHITLDAARQVASLAPYGVGFPEPLFLLRNVVLRRVTPRGEGRHAAFSAQSASSPGPLLDGICFRDEAFVALRPGDRVDVVFNLQINEWNGRSKPELCVRDWRLAA